MRSLYSSSALCHSSSRALSAGQTIEIDSFTLQLSVAAAAAAASRIVGPGMARRQTMGARERSREKPLTTIENQNNNKHTHSG